MNQSRFQIRQGSAARSSTGEDLYSTQHLVRGVQAASAARDAEQRKRAEAGSPARATMSLRSQEGRVFRRKEESSPVQPGPTEIAGERSTASAAAYTKPASPEGDAPTQEPLLSATSSRLLRRLRSIFT